MPVLLVLSLQGCQSKSTSPLFSDEVLQRSHNGRVLQANLDVHESLMVAVPAALPLRLQGPAGAVLMLDFSRSPQPLDGVEVLELTLDERGQGSLLLPFTPMLEGKLYIKIIATSNAGLRQSLALPLFVGERPLSASDGAPHRLPVQRY